VFDFSLWSVVTHADTLLLVVGVCALAAWASRLRDPQSEVVEKLTEGFAEERRRVGCSLRKIKRREL
jgi:hypothetical protein